MKQAPRLMPTRRHLTLWLASTALFSSGTTAAVEATTVPQHKRRRRLAGRVSAGAAQQARFKPPAGAWIARPPAN